MTTSNQYINYTITITQNSQSIDGNYSNITVSVRFYRTNTGYTTSGSGTVYCKIDETTYSASVSSSQQITNSGIVLFSTTLNVPHSSDGTKTLTCSAWISHSRFSSSEQSYSQALETIPRRSSISFDTFTMGTPGTITISRASSSFTHTIVYLYGSTSGTIITKTTSTSINWTPKVSLADQIPAKTSGTGIMTCYTYSGDTQIGEYNVAFTLNINSDAKPTCSISVSDASTAFDTYGSYVRGISKLNITVTGTPYYGSAISSYKTTVDGSNYTTSSFTTGILKSYGALTISSSATDKRGRTGTASTSVTAINYNAPIIDKFTVSRCDQDGTVNSQGGYVKATMSATISALNDKNTAKYVLKYKKSSDTSYVTVTLSDLDNVYNVNNETYIFTANTGYSYDVSLSVTDSHSTTTKSTSASTAFTLMHFNKSGNAMAIGKVSETEKTFEVGMNTTLYKPALMQQDAGNTYFEFERTDTGTKFAIGININGTTYGIRNQKTSKWLINENNSEVYVNDKRVMHGKNENGYWGLMDPDGEVSTWIRTTQNGLIPYASGGNSSSLGSSEWAFKNIYGMNLFRNGNPVYGAKVLYSNDSGSTGTVTLNETSANFTMMDIIYKDNTVSGYKSLRVYSPNGKTVNCDYVFYSSDYNTTQIGIVHKIISGTSITNGNNRYININASNGVSNGNCSVPICYVIGYK